MASERKVTVIPPTHKYHRRVAIYCRVSSRSQEQLASLSTQASYLTRMVAEKPGWQLLDIYLDAKPGSDMADRSEFQRLLSDCRAGKIDIVLTKSISRFGRNTVETLAVINELRAKGVEIVFEMEEISTNDSASQLYISILEGVAQEENTIRGDNIRLGIKHKIENGTARIFCRKCYGYINDESGELHINDIEAEVVRCIFDMYLKGMSIIGIKRELERRGTLSPTGNSIWCKRSIENILANEKYTGDALVFKTYCEGYPETKRKSNKDLKHDQYISISNNPTIISKETFEAIQEEKRRRSNVITSETGVKRKSTKYSSKKIETRKNSLAEQAHIEE